MGWCSGTDVFDSVCGAVLKNTHSGEAAKSIIKELIKSLWEQDWDAEFDSEFIKSPIVQECFEELNPSFFRYFDEE